MEKQIYSLIFNEDEISWQSLLMELVRSEGMDPWDIDVSKLAHSYIKTVKKLKEANLRISGKVILASAMLLKVKSNRLVKEELEKLDTLFKQAEESAEYLDDLEDVNLLEPLLNGKADENPLYPKTPQPRKRKVSVFDLVEAMEKAMDVRKRRVITRLPYARKKIQLPNSVDISEIIVKVYKDIISFFKNGKKTVTFTELLPAQDKESKVFTFMPLLHLSNERRIDLHQKEHFGEIEIELLKRRNIRVAKA
ncbi:segregation/condensation protein A [Candidatus Woesearchaeota archaeon]|nr:segregation/condensation protein A [Candidatus Woesearchaeota archaeon]MBW3017705.1 segregation/condensation protein A [Candidatus Woesearchaeota archaeon]